MIMIHPELRRALATERERSLLEKAQRASLLRDSARPTPPASAHRQPFIFARLSIALRGRFIAIHAHPSAIEHARQEPKDEPRTGGRPALQSEVQDWAIRKTPSATIEATPPTSTDSTRSRSSRWRPRRDGGTADLDALPDLDLLPEADPPVAGKAMKQYTDRYVYFRERLRTAPLRGGPPP